MVAGVRWHVRLDELINRTRSCGGALEGLIENAELEEIEGKIDELERAITSANEQASDLEEEDEDESDEEDEVEEEEDED